jgi:hypothetical protein
MLAKKAYVQIYMQDKLTQKDIRFQQHSYCNTNINVILLGYLSSVSFDFVKQRIINQFVQQWSIFVYDCEKPCIYRNIKVEFCHEKYLNFCSNVYLLT